MKYKSFGKSCFSLCLHFQQTMIYFSVHTHVLHFLSSHSYDIIVMFILEIDDVDLPVVFVGKVSMVKGSSCECFSHLLSHLLKHLHKMVKLPGIENKELIILTVKQWNFIRKHNSLNPSTEKWFACNFSRNIYTLSSKQVMRLLKLSR